MAEQREEFKSPELEAALLEGISSAPQPYGAETLERIRQATSQGGRSVLDIPTVSVGRILRPFPASDDLLGEMLEGRIDLDD